MSKPVDLTHLRELTGGEPDMEKQLFALFISSSKECIAKLEKNCTDGENIEWRKEAHALKGSAVNIGAQGLADICAKAQNSFIAPGKEKEKLLASIKKSFNEATDFLNSLH